MEQGREKLQKCKNESSKARSYKLGITGHEMAPSMSKHLEAYAEYMDKKYIILQQLVSASKNDEDSYKSHFKAIDDSCLW